MALRVGTLLPSLEGATQWFNGAISAEELRGHPVLLHFWAVSCPACLHSMPSLQQWRSEYSASGLRIVAVHLPRMERDRDISRVEQAIAEKGIVWPCAVDHDGVLGERFDTGTVWPYYFLFDAEGQDAKPRGGWRRTAPAGKRVASLDAGTRNRRDRSGVKVFRKNCHVERSRDILSFRT